MDKLQTQDLRGLSADALAGVAEQMLRHIAQMGRQIASQAQAIKFRDVKLERVMF